MNSSECAEFDFLDSELFDDREQEQQIKAKSRKRKWREIENIKEQRRFKKELAEYDQYSL